MILCQFIGLLDQDRCPIPFFKRKGFVGLTFAQLIGSIKHLLSFATQPTNDLKYSLSPVEVVLWRCNHIHSLSCFGLRPAQTSLAVRSTHLIYYRRRPVPRAIQLQLTRCARLFNSTEVSVLYQMGLDAYTKVGLAIVALDETMICERDHVF